MANDPSEAKRAAQAALDEAARTLAESSRRTSEQAQQATRTFLDQSNDMTRTVFNTWTSSTEALWRVAFELNNTQLHAGLAWWHTLADSSRSTGQLLAEWDGVTRKAQTAWLEVFQASARVLASAIDQGTSAAERRTRPTR
jgi:hypothetical protein